MAEETEQKTTPETTGDKATAKPVENKYDLDDNDLSSAASLYKALKDPETSMEIVTAMARKAGLLDKTGDNKESKKETETKLEGKVHKMLKARLGKDFEKFSDQIGPVIDDAVQEYLKEHFQSNKAESAQETWESSVTEFMKDKEIPSKVEKAMEAIIKEAPPNVRGKEFNASKYLNRVYKNALEELDMAPPAKARARRGEEEIADFVVRDRPKNLTTNDAIDAALKGIRFR